MGRTPRSPSRARARSSCSASSRPSASGVVMTSLVGPLHGECATGRPEGGARVATLARRARADHRPAAARSSGSSPSTRFRSAVLLMTFLSFFIGIFLQLMWEESADHRAALSALVAGIAARAWRPGRAGDPSPVGGAHTPGAPPPSRVGLLRNGRTRPPGRESRAPVSMRTILHARPGRAIEEGARWRPTTPECSSSAAARPATRPRSTPPAPGSSRS